MKVNSVSANYGIYSNRSGIHNKTKPNLQNISHKGILGKVAGGIAGVALAGVVTTIAAAPVATAAGIYFIVKGIEYGDKKEEELKNDNSNKK